MPDGDKVHQHLAGPYQQLYKQICEGQDGPEKLGRDAMRPVRRSLEHYGDGPIALVKQVMTPIDRLPKEPILRRLALEKARGTIPSIARVAQGSKRGIELATDACRQVIQDACEGKDSNHLLREALSRYVIDIYRADFEERIPLSRAHDRGVDQATIAMRLDLARPYVERNAMILAVQLNKGCDVRKLRLPRQASLSYRATLNDNLL